jgi:hypothetical protein
MVVAALPLCSGVTIGWWLVRGTIASMPFGRWHAGTRRRARALISHRHMAAVAKLIQPVGHDPLPGGQPGVDGEEVSVLRP